LRLAFPIDGTESYAGLAGEEAVAFPQPERLARSGRAAGLRHREELPLARDRRCCARGTLDVATLHALGPDAAWSAPPELPGIGPFYAGLIVLRAATPG
jgi:DNA-3-methyladenine glycosylase II